MTRTRFILYSPINIKHQYRPSTAVFGSCSTRSAFVLWRLEYSWERASTLLSRCCLYRQIVAKYLCNQCLAHLRSGCRWNKLLYGINHSMLLHYQESMNTTRGSKRFSVVCFLWPSNTASVVILYPHYLNVLATGHGFDNKRRGKCFDEDVNKMAVKHLQLQYCLDEKRYPLGVLKEGEISSVNHCHETGVSGMKLWQATLA